MKVLIVGDMRVGTNSRSVAEGYKAAGYDVRWIDTGVATAPKKGSRLWFSIRQLQRVTAEENARIRAELQQMVENFAPDVMVAIKVIHYDQQAFLSASIPVKIHLSFDDVSNPDNTSPEYLRHESGWDLIITTKRHNVPELFGRGAKDVLFVWGAYDPQFRRRTLPTAQRKFDVGFIGAARPDRSDLPVQFAQNVPNKGAIYGPRWNRRYPLGVRGVALMPSATGVAYTEAANNMKIGLILLNSDNRDQHTNRTFEAPASGQMVLAQRTNEHAEVFDDGVNALLFESMGQAWEIVKELQNNPDRISRIAEAGYKLIAGGGHTYQDRAHQVLKHVAQ